MIRLKNALGFERILPVTMAFRRVPFEADVPHQPLYGRDGNVKTGSTTLRPRQFVLEGSVYYPDKDRIEQEFDALLSFLMHSPIEVYRQHYHDRFLWAHPAGAPQEWLDAGAELQLRIPMIALDPFWYGEKVTINVSGTQSLLVDGTAPTRPRVISTGSVSSLMVSNGTTDQSIAVTGANGVVEVDNANHTCTVDGENRLDLIDERWFLFGFELLPGTNRITTNAPITLIYRPRWY